MRPICYIVGAGDCPALTFSPRPGDRVIAADGGCLPLKAAGLSIDLAVGDFDSLPEPPAGVPVERHPVRKDDTDMMLAVKLGLQEGFDRFVLYGGLGAGWIIRWPIFRRCTIFAAGAPGAFSPTMPRP